LSGFPARAITKVVHPSNWTDPMAVSHLNSQRMMRRYASEACFR
jgi:hypothetical protein